MDYIKIRLETHENIGLDLTLFIISLILRLDYFYLI